jgi:acetylornithine deacetylase
MKGGLVCAFTALEMLKDEGFRPKGDITFESVVDEEYASSAGSISARLMGYNADFAIIFEPTCLKINTACVGSIVLKAVIKGVAGMPYTGETVVNPVYMLGEFITIIREYEKTRLSKTPHPLWKDTPQAVQLVITKAKSGDVRPNGQLSTPIDAWIELVIQTYPGEDMPRVFEEFKTFVYERFSNPDMLSMELEYHHCLSSDQHRDAGAGIEVLRKHALTHTDKAQVCGAMFSCDLFAFTKYGDMPAAVFGPIGERLHGPDEWVSIGSMEKVTLAVRDFIIEWCG